MPDAGPSERLILDRMQAPGARGLYVLGCFERRVTLYSQQVRALNLVYALRELPWETLMTGLARALRHADAALRRRALELVPIYAAATADTRARIALMTTEDADAEVRAAAVEAQHGLEALDAISAYRPEPPAPATS